VSGSSCRTTDTWQVLPDDRNAESTYLGRIAGFDPATDGVEAALHFAGEPAFDERALQAAEHATQFIQSGPVQVHQVARLAAIEHEGRAERSITVMRGKD